MNKTFSSSFLIPPLALALSLLTACSKPAASVAADAHAGHEHGAEISDSKNQVSKKICAEHAVPLEECGICRPQLAGVLKPGESAKLRLASSDSASIAGVEIAAPTKGSISDAVECYAELSFNQNKLARISAPVSGIVQEVTVDLGSQAAEKQVVVRLWSAGIAEAAAKAVLSHQSLARERSLRAEKVSSERDLQEAEAGHRAACQQLITLGFTEEQIEAFTRKPQEQILLDLRAPFAGEIVERSAVCGAMVEAGRPLFTVADRSQMWAMLSIPESALGRVKTGQVVELRVESLPDRVFTGKLTWISADIDEKSRMARARVEVPNADGALKARMFAHARILTRTTEAALLVPPSAIQHVDGNTMVFVKLQDDLFDARAVRLGARFNNQQEILEGLQPGDLVAVNHGFSLKSALLISRLGAGCADD